VTLSASQHHNANKHNGEKEQEQGDDDDEDVLVMGALRYSKVGSARKMADAVSTMRFMSS